MDRCLSSDAILAEELVRDLYFCSLGLVSQAVTRPIEIRVSLRLATPSFGRLELEECVTSR